MTIAADASAGLGRKAFNRVLHTYFLMRRSLTIGVRAAIRHDDGRFVLVRHTYVPGWHFPGGGVERGQTTRHMLERELREETGLEINGNPTLHGVFLNRAISRRDHILVYLCDVKGVLHDRPASMEIAEIGLFGLHDLPGDTDPGTKRRIQEIVNGTMPHEVW